MVFSVVIPIYNAEKYLEQCLDSLLMQSYRNWKAILVDDGSPDRSGAIADAYGERDARFTVIHKSNEGQMKARLTGICAADGDVLMFLDSDDWWEPYCLEAVAEVFKNDGIDTVFFPARVVDAQGTVRCLVGEAAERSGEIEKRKIYESILASYDLNSMCLKAFKKSLFSVAALKEVAEKGVRQAEDKLMLLPIITNANKIYYLKEVLYVYRRNEDSTSHKRNVSQIPEIIAKPVFEEVYKYMGLWGMDDASHKRKLELYYLRTVLSCYYAVRRSCTTKTDKKVFRQYPWKAELKNRFAKYLLRAGLKPKEKLKLLLMRMSL